MDIWLLVATWVVAHLHLFGPVIFVSAWLSILLPLLIAQTPHAKAQVPAVPGFPMWPGAHFRLLGCAFGRDAYLAGGPYARTLLWLYRVATIMGGVGVTLLFAAFVSLDPVLSSAR
jgi:hypothetical protein